MKEERVLRLKVLEAHGASTVPHPWMANLRGFMAALGWTANDMNGIETRWPASPEARLGRPAEAHLQRGGSEVMVAAPIHSCPRRGKSSHLSGYRRTCRASRRREAPVASVLTFPRPITTPSALRARATDPCTSRAKDVECCVKGCKGLCALGEADIRATHLCSLWQGARMRGGASVQSSAGALHPVYAPRT